MAASALLPSGATAQRADGAIGVAIMILPPSVLQSVVLSDVRIDQPTASRRTEPATTTRGRQVLMSRLSGDRRGSAATRRELVPSCAVGRSGCAPYEIERCVDFISDSPGDTVRVVRLRREYFVVAGT